MRRNKKPLNRRQRHAIAVMEAGHKRKTIRLMGNWIEKIVQRGKYRHQPLTRLRDAFASLRPSVHVPAPRDISGQQVQPVFSAKAMHERVELDEITHGTVKELIKQILD